MSLIERKIANILVRLSARLSRSTRQPWPYLSVGRHTYGQVNVVHFAGDPPVQLQIGDYCSIADGVEFIVGGQHRLDWVSTYPFRVINDLDGAFEDGHPCSRGPIIIGNDVWIGRKATILSGVTVGDGACIAANAVVASDVRSYAVVAGLPAREVRRRFTDTQCDALVRAKWWDWPHDEVLRTVELLNGVSVDALISYAATRSARHPTIEH